MSVAFSLLLLLSRFIHTGSLQYAFLLWNLFLAWVPCHITLLMQSYGAVRWSLLVWWGAFGAWLVFLPNAPYILTDLYHLPEGGAPRWFDLILILSFAWNGLILGFISIRQMQVMCVERFPQWPVRLFVLPVMLLCGWGVYIGRYLRWNSWDLLVAPVPLLRETGAMLLHPLQYAHAWGFSICLGLFMHIIYNLKKG
ncbi:DUF1361 domain-containing protein [Chitinophaga japonensis]|nr:DUF1361 domain-containing protein [Chitinophaga japonensis]